MRRTTSAYILAAAVLLFGAVVLLNAWTVSAFSHSGSIQSAVGRYLLYSFRFAAAAGGVLFVIKRNSAALDGMLRSVFGRVGRGAAYVLILCLLYLVSENISYFIFNHVLGEDHRAAAMLAAGVPEEQPAYLPHLFADYRANPNSAQSSPYGFRYGGGPKKASVRILCLGGSTTYSEYVSRPEESYPAQLEAYLRAKGYDAEVVNAGCGYYTSAECLGSLCFLGAYTAPDIVIIHTGLNDMEPLLSPREYRPDYSHWRSVTLDRFDGNTGFAAWWRVPSWTARVFALVLLQPDGANAFTGRQQTTIYEALYATNDVSKRYNLGLERNLRSIVGVVRSLSALPVVVTAQYLPQHPNNWIVNNGSTDPAARDRARRRSAAAVRHNNLIMVKTADDMNVPVIPFHTFAPSSPQMRVDHCHLNAAGCAEKAAFIGEFLIQRDML